MNNIPKIKLGVVAVSRDCFPESLSVNRRKALIDAYEGKYGKGDIYECPICIVESEIHMMQALEDLKKAECNALCVYLGNFGPEISETMLAQRFDGPVMFCAAAEESGSRLVGDRGDAYCGMLNASYNLKLRNVKAYIPEYPVGDAQDCADMLHEFLPIARAICGLKDLKIISFGPRPLNFMACNAPIKQLFNIGVEIEENSELDLFESFNKHEGDERIPSVVADMEKELGKGNKKPEILKMIVRSYARHISTEAAISTIIADVRQSNERSLDVKTFNEYTEALQDLYILEDMKAWNPNIRSKTSIRSTPTRHFIDTSIACRALGVMPNDLLRDLESFGLFFLYIFRNACRITFTFIMQF